MNTDLLPYYHYVVQVICSVIHTLYGVHKGRLTRSDLTDCYPDNNLPAIAREDWGQWFDGLPFPRPTH
jgi:hypothetical protein